MKTYWNDIVALPSISCGVIVKFKQFSFGGHLICMMGYNHNDKTFYFTNKCDEKKYKDCEIIGWIPEPDRTLDRELVGLPIE